MEQRAVEITQLQDEHADSVARLHLTCLPTHFTGACGHGLLRTYYGVVADGQGASGFVALDDKQVVGYICGVWDTSRVQKTIIRKHGMTLLYLGLQHLIKRPKLLSDALRWVQYSHAESTSDGYELRPIVVAETHRGTGLATSLVERLLYDAVQRRFSSVHLFCDPNNLRARRLYERHGFRYASTILTAGQPYLRYSICTGASNHER